MLLRSFGHDGGILGTRGGGSKSPAPAFTIEDLIGEAALTAGYSGGVQALHDHDCNEIPVGPTYVKVEVSRWESIVRSALAGAPVIALLATPGRRLGPSSKDELAMIRRLGLGSKVLVIGAPGVDAHTHEILDELGWPVPTSVPFVAHLDGRGRIAIDPSLGERDRYDVARYQNAIHSGLVQIR